MPLRVRPFSLLTLAVAPLLGGLLGLVLILTAPAPVSAASSSCGQPFNMVDADAENGWDPTTPTGAYINAYYGQSTSLAYPGYTNDPYVDADAWRSSSFCTGSTFNKQTWYANDSRFAGSLAGYASSTASSNTQWSSLQESDSAIYSASQDWSPNLYGLDLTVRGWATLNAGTITQYLDHWNCQYITGTWGDGAVRRTGGTGSEYGAWAWIVLTVGNQYSVYSDYGTQAAGGGGANNNLGSGNGNCIVATGPPTSDTIIYDVTRPTVTVNIASGATATANNLVSFAVTATDATAGNWLMAFSNNATCNASSTYTDWIAYSTASQSNWDLTDYVYDYAGGSVATVCVRVMDRSGNIGYGKDTIVYDVVGPEITQFSAPATRTKNTTVAYTLSFDESATGLTTADLTNVGTASCSTPVISGSGSSYTVTYTCAGAPEGSTVEPLLRSSAVTDAYSNSGPSFGEYGTEVTFDYSAPTVTSFALTSNATYDTGTSQSDRITNASTLQFTLVFSERVTGLAAADFSANLAGCVVGSPSGSTTYTVNLTGCPEGNLTLTLAANSVADLATNAGPPTPATASATIDRTGPTGCTLAIAAGAAFTSTAVNDLTIGGCVGATFGLDRMRFSNNGSLWSAYEPYNSSKNNWDLTDATVGGSVLEGTRTVTLQVTDTAGNLSSATDTILFDRTAPTATFTSPAGDCDGTGTAFSYPCTNLAAYPLTYTVSDGTGSGISTTVPTTLTRYKAAVVGGSCPTVGASYSIDVVEYPTVNNLTSFLSAGLTDGSCYYWALKTTDGVGNQAAGTSARLLVDRVAPSVSSFILGDGSGVTTSPLLTGSVSATDTLSGMAKARWSLSNGADWAGLTCAQSALSYSTNRTPGAFSLTAGGGDYGVTVEVCDFAGNTTTMKGVVRLNSLKRMPVLTLGADIRTCSPSDTYSPSINSSGVVYWPVGQTLCFFPKPQQRTAGTDTTNGRNWVGQLDSSATTSYTVLSTNPCTGACAGLIGLYPTSGAYTYTTPSGQHLVATAGQITWTVPAGVTSISAVAIGGGGGGRRSSYGGAGGAGGALAYATSIAVTPGEILYLTVGAGGATASTNATTGGLTAIRRGSHTGTNLLVAAGGGGASSASSSATSSTGGVASTAGCVAGTVCFAGGAGGNAGSSSSTGGGGGAGGYSGVGGAGGNNNGSGSASTGGGGGGGGGGTSGNGAGGGGGVGLLGAGANGSAGAAATYGKGGGAGSGGSTGSDGGSSSGGPGGSYGGGGGGADDTGNNGSGSSGALRIVYGYSGSALRAYPSTGIADASGSTETGLLTLRLDRETSDAASSLPAVSVVVRATVTVNWYLATCTSNCAVQATSTYSVDLELRVRSLGIGQRPG